MTKQEALRRVRQAKSAHIRWRAHAHTLLEEEIRESTDESF